MNTMLHAALDYHSRGWAVIPMRIDKRKKPAVRWKPYQTSRPTKQRIKGWFGDGTEFGIAVIFGEISGGLASRDFDAQDAYEDWERCHPDLAATLPMVQTRRGRHVYFRTDPREVVALRFALGKPDGTGAIDCGDGELRIGCGCYSVLPPSPHPKGGHYEWITQPPDQIPLVRLDSSGFIPCNRERRDGRESREERESRETRDNVLAPSRPSLLHAQIEAAIRRTIPKEGGRRHRAIFEFARELKAISELAEANALELKPIVRAWHQQAQPFIRTKPFEGTWFDFAEGWGKVKYPKGQEPIAAIFAQAINQPPPKAAQQYEQDGLRRLVAFCRELQREAGSEAFYLSSVAAGELLGVDASTAWRWLKGLQHDHILRLETHGSYAENRANRYRFLPNLGNGT